MPSESLAYTCVNVFRSESRPRRYVVSTTLHTAHQYISPRGNKAIKHCALPGNVHDLSTVGVFNHRASCDRHRIVEIVSSPSCRLQQWRHNIYSNYDMALKVNRAKHIDVPLLTRVLPPAQHEFLSSCLCCYFEACYTPCSIYYKDIRGRRSARSFMYVS